MPDNIRRCIKTLKELMIPQSTIDLIKLESGIDGALDKTIANIYMSKAIDMFLKWKEAYAENKS
eukprot:3764400-Ditylum_brightwellii.AAC.1